MQNCLYAKLNIFKSFFFFFLIKKILACYVHGQISNIYQFWLISPTTKKAINLLEVHAHYVAISKLANGFEDIFHTSLTIK